MTKLFANRTPKKLLILELAVTTILILILYYPILKTLVSDWNNDPNYSHGFLIPFISGYIIWERRKQLKKTTPEPCNWGLLILLAGLVVLILGTIGSELFTKRFSLLIVLGGTILFLSGKQAVKHLFFPLSFLLFMIPLPYILYDAIAFPLKLLASKIAGGALLLLNIPVFREGNIIHLASTTLEVADACSGIRSLVSLIALGVLFAHISQNALWKKIVLILSTVPIAIVANVCRVAGTGILAHHWSPEIATGFFHTFSGWLIFVVAFVLLFGVGAILRAMSYKL